MQNESENNLTIQFMKNGKKIKLSLNKQIIASLDNETLKGVKGGKEQQGLEAEFLTIFNCSKNCSRSPSCAGLCSVICDITVEF